MKDVAIVGATLTATTALIELLVWALNGAPSLDALRLGLVIAFPIVIGLVVALGGAARILWERRRRFNSQVNR